MAISESDLKKAKIRGRKLRAKGYAVLAKYEPISKYIFIEMNTGLKLMVPVGAVSDLHGASPSKLSDIEITASGLGLHWPKLDVDLYVPGLLAGDFHSKRIAAAELGASGGKVRSEAKSAAARENGKRGGRPRRVA